MARSARENLDSILMSTGNEIEPASALVRSEFICSFLFVLLGVPTETSQNYLFSSNCRKIFWSSMQEDRCRWHDAVVVVKVLAVSMVAGKILLSYSTDMRRSSRDGIADESARKSALFNDETLPVISCKEIVKKDPMFVSLTPLFLL